MERKISKTVKFVSFDIQAQKRKLELTQDNHFKTKI